MYLNVREVTWGLCLSLFNIVIAGVVSWIDPFHNGVPWANWLALAVISVIAATAATIIAVCTDDEASFWGFLALCLFLWLFGGALITGVTTSGLHDRYHSLAWSVFALPLVVLPISALVQYLVMAREMQREAAADDSIRSPRRVA